MDREQRRREKLYRNFKESLTGGDTPPAYDENDLVDIFDYANDMYDEYVQFEVILLAARLYPESEEMMQRRAFYMYGNLSMTDGAANLAAAHRQESALWTLLDLMVRHPSESECKSVMQSVIDRYSEFDDETAIQLVDVCSDLGIFDWLTEHKEEIQKRCAYPETFLYELAMEADSRGEYKLAAKFMEELTDREPFNAMFWHMLAQLQVRLDNYTDALASIDYALAIDADATAYRLTKAQIMFDMKTDKVKAVEIVEDVLKTEPDNKLAVHTLAVMYTIENRSKDAVALVKNYLVANPSDQVALEHLLMFGDRDSAVEAVKRYFSESTGNAEEWTAWAKSLYNRGQYRECADILLALLAWAGEIPEWTPMLEGLYRSGEYQAIVTLYRDIVLAVEDISRLGLSMTDALIFVLALVRCGQYMAAKKLADIVTGVEFHDIYPFEKRLSTMKVCDVMKTVGAAIMSGRDFDLNSLDPFSEPHS